VLCHDCDFDCLWDGGRSTLEVVKLVINFQELDCFEVTRERVMVMAVREDQ
jgi:hypothetical protein